MRAIYSNGYSRETLQKQQKRLEAQEQQDDNQLTSEIPEELCNLSDSLVFDLSDNQMGFVPVPVVPKPILVRNQLRWDV